MNVREVLKLSISDARENTLSKLPLFGGVVNGPDKKYTDYKYLSILLYTLTIELAIYYMYLLIQVDKNHCPFFLCVGFRNTIKW